MNNASLLHGFQAAQKKKTENGTKMIGLQEKKKKLREVLPVMYSGGHSTIVSSKKKKKC